VEAWTACLSLLWKSGLSSKDLHRTNWKAIKVPDEGYVGRTVSSKFPVVYKRGDAMFWFADGPHMDLWRGEGGQ
jgi:hypothetical protein